MNIKQLQEIQKKAAEKPPEIQKTVKVDTEFGEMTADVPHSAVQKNEAGEDVSTTAVQTAELELTDDKMQLAIQEAHLEQASAQELLDQFSPLMAEAKKLANMAKGVTVTAVDQTLEMKLARQLRLGLREIRVNADKIRKRLKEDSLRRGKAIDGVFHVIEYLITPIEDRMLEAEEFAERVAAKAKEEMKSGRETLLRPYSIDTSFYDLAAMSDDAFFRLLDDTKRSHESKVAETIRLEKEKAQSDRLEKLKSSRTEQLAKFNLTPLAAYGITTTDFPFADNRIELLSDAQFELIRIGAEKHAEKIEEDRKKADELNALIDRQHDRAVELVKYGGDFATVNDPASDFRTMPEPDFRKYAAARKADFEKKAAQEKARQAKLEADAEKGRKAQRDLEARQQADRDAQAKKKKDAAKAARAPDKKKLIYLAEEIERLNMPEMKTAEGQSALDMAMINISSVVNTIKVLAEEL